MSVEGKSLEAEEEVEGGKEGGGLILARLCRQVEGFGQWHWVPTK